ncbi:MAG: metal-dependent transcriptional regulator [Thermoprotei archaeon]|nr:MAG: metal-dependent transcriptional regulator [Thermoprotei archaeon]RLF02725.1 MAG: metal-dependent transcriptional regulator [Thermoprotei archaeon]
MSRREYEYLYSIYIIAGTAYARLTDIARSINVKPSTALEFLGKLEKKGFVEKRPRRGYKLTHEGLSRIQDFIRRHRIAETFLVKELGYDPGIACRLASEFDIYLPEDVVNRICEKLGHPSMCPHGYPIPPGSCSCSTMERKRWFQ